MALVVRVRCLHSANIDWTPSGLGTRIMQCIKHTDILILMHLTAEICDLSGWSIEANSCFKTRYLRLPTAEKPTGVLVRIPGRSVGFILWVVERPPIPTFNSLKEDRTLQMGTCAPGEICRFAKGPETQIILGQLFSGT